jgi:hypothetical protein
LDPRVAGFFLVHDTTTGKKQKIFQMAIRYIKFSNLNPPKFTQIGIFGLKTNHLATLLDPVIPRFRHQ